MTSPNWYLYPALFLFFPGLLFSLGVGLLAKWIDRKVTARVQWRVGPPLLQPLYDLLKLMGKEVVMPAAAHPVVFIFAPVVGLAGAALSALILGGVNFFGWSFVGDLIVVVYLLLLPPLAVVIGGSASGNPHSSIGSSREMKLVLAYELPLGLALITVIINSGFTLNLVEIAAAATVKSVSGLIAFVVTLVCVQAKLTEVPFDIPEAETEIMEGPLVEYSGLPLACFEAMQAMLLYLLPLYVITLFLGGLGQGWGLVWGVLKYVLILVAIILVKNTNPRLRIDQAIRFFWSWMTGLSFLAVALSVYGHVYGVSWL